MYYQPGSVIFEEVNDAYCKLYDYDHDELVNQPFTIVVPEEARDDMAQRHDDFFDQQHEFSGYWDVIRQDGTTRRNSSQRRPT